MFSRDSVVAERKWAVLVGVTTSGSPRNLRHISLCGASGTLHRSF